MDLARKPYFKDLAYLGFVEGVTYLSSSQSSSSSSSGQGCSGQRELCHYFGGIPYALPPVGPFRWKLPRPLPSCYKYGAQLNPGRFSGGARLCPQPAYRGSNPDANLIDEDCLHLNIWLPAGTPPTRGWAVLFFIHGGWLQFGSPNATNFTALLGETECQCIIVCPAYRLNLFGFLACTELEQEAGSTGESAGNFGFYDQRLALEWTHKNISCFGGDAANITVSGYSAGAHSTFHQLSYDLFQPSPARRLIRRAIMFSNGSGMQPKSIREVQDQFDSLLDALHVPHSLCAAEKLARLRTMAPAILLAAAETLSLHEFRAVTDGVFVRHSLFADIESGEYARRMVAGGVELMIGECADEHHIYGTWRPPRAQSLAAVQTRLMADYPTVAVLELMRQHYCPSGEQLPSAASMGKKDTTKDWDDAFGRVYADLQVHALERGFVDRLVRAGAAALVHRYRVEWRASCSVSDAVPKEWDATHGTDMAIWFWGNGMVGRGGQAGLTVEEKVVAKSFVEPLWRFITGNATHEVKGPQQVRRLRKDGRVDWWIDDDWERGLKIWNIIHEAQQRAERSDRTRL